MNLVNRLANPSGSYPRDVIEYIRRDILPYGGAKFILNKLVTEGARNHERVLGLNKSVAEFNLNELYWLAAFDIRLHFFTEISIKKQDKDAWNNLVARYGENEARYIDAQYATDWLAGANRHGSNDILLYDIKPSLWGVRLEDAEERSKSRTRPLIVDIGRVIEYRKWPDYYDNIYWKYAQLIVADQWRRLPKPDEVCDIGSLIKRNLGFTDSWLFKPR